MSGWTRTTGVYVDVRYHPFVNCWERWSFDFSSVEVEIVVGFVKYILDKEKSKSILKQVVIEIVCFYEVPVSLFSYEKQ